MAPMALGNTPTPRFFLLPFHAQSLSLQVSLVTVRNNTRSSIRSCLKMLESEDWYLTGRLRFQ
jgi:hypothetical protein